jgi:hypothetical protein
MTFVKSIAAASVILALCTVPAPATAAAHSCDKSCLEGIAERYRAAYLKHDPKLAPIAATVRFTENNVEMQFPDGSWDTVTEQVVPALTLSDPQSGNVGFYTAIMQREIQGYLAVRLKVIDGQITEIEHMLSTKRNLSSPPTPFGDVHEFQHDPDLERTLPPAERATRARVIERANGYFSTLQHNTGQIYTRFSADATRRENGLKFTNLEQAFKLGRYAFNERVRDRDFFLVDEERGIVMARGFIDHKGVMDEYTLNDGTKTRSVFQEPQTWAFLEMFKVKNDMITGVEATFIQAPYYMRSPWTLKPDPR